MASRISPSLGSGLRSSSARAVIIIPGVQKPHWRPWQAMNPCCTGSSTLSCSSPSTVRTSRPPAIAARTVHDLTGSPSIQTTQVPQLLVSQPQCVPVSPRWSRRKCTSSSRPSISRETSSPLTVIVTCMSALLGDPGDRAPQRPLGELSGQVPLVLDAPPQVGDGAAARSGDRTCLGVELLGRRVAAQRLGDGGDPGCVGA